MKPSKPTREWRAFTDDERVIGERQAIIRQNDKSGNRSYKIKLKVRMHQSFGLVQRVMHQFCELDQKVGPIIDAAVSEEHWFE